MSALLDRAADWVFGRAWDAPWWHIALPLAGVPIGIGLIMVIVLLTCR